MIDTDKYEGHTPAPWMMGEYKGRPSIHAGNETFVRSIARGLNPSQTADHALLLDAPLLLADYKRLREYAGTIRKELKQTRESLWWCYDNYRFDGHPMVGADWNFIGNLLGADMESEEE